MEDDQEIDGPKSESRLKSALTLLRRNKELPIGATVVAILIGTAVAVEIANLLGRQITPYNPLAQDVGPVLAPPSWAHLFGTDLVGSDVFSRVVAATPNDMAVGLAVVGVAFLVGTIIGTAAAFKGGMFDELLMRFTDVVFALPIIIIAMVVAVTLGPGLINMMVALMAIWWPPYARLARGQALTIKHQSYIEAARFSGMGTGRMIVKHVIPNVFTTMLVYATLDLGIVILTYAGLSYLGLSVRPPYPDWGEMVSSYQDYMIAAPWLPLVPGLIIVAGVVGFSLLGDGIRDALESR